MMLQIVGYHFESILLIEHLMHCNYRNFRTEQKLPNIYVTNWPFQPKRLVGSIYLFHPAPYTIALQCIVLTRR